MSKYKIVNKQSGKSFAVENVSTFFSCTSPFNFRREVTLKVDDCAKAEDVLNYNKLFSRRDLEDLNSVVVLYELEPDGGEIKVIEFYAASICDINHESKECLINFESEMFYMETELAYKEYAKYKKAEDVQKQLMEWSKIGMIGARI